MTNSVTKHIKIYADVDVSLAISALNEYLTLDFKRNTVGAASSAIYVFTDDVALCVYQTATCYVIRRNY